jgi:tetratricopeptide (TPR) repeat protein
MNVKVIQQKVLIGDQVKFTLQNGHSASGVLTELTKEYVTLENSSGSATLMVEKIESFEVFKLDDSKSEKQNLPQGNGASNSNEDAHVHSNTTGIGVDFKGWDSVLPSKPIQPVPPQENGGSVADTLALAPKAEDHKEATLPEPELHTVSPATWRKVIEVEATYKIQIDSAQIGLTSPDFEAISAVTSWQKGEDTAKWNSIKNQYDYAKKMKEIDAKFGRVQSITFQLKSLIESYPSSVPLKRCLAYCYALVGTPYSLGESIRWYHMTALESGEAQDWVCLAAVAQHSNRGEVTCYALERYFQAHPIGKELTSWYVFIKLVMKFGNYSALRELLSRYSQQHTETEITVLFEASVYLLSALRGQQEALDLVESSASGISLNTLIQEALDHFKQEPASSYREAIKTAVTVQSVASDSKILSLKDSATFIPKKKIVAAPVNTDFEVIPKVEQSSRTHTAADYYRLAVRFSHNPPIAISHIKKVLSIDPNYPGAQELFEKLREKARVATVPAGTNPYAKAKQSHMIERDLNKAVDLYRYAVEENDKFDTALKDLANLLNQLGRYDETLIEIDRHRGKTKDPASLDSFYNLALYKLGKYPEAIKLIRKRLITASITEKPTLIWYLANCYIKVQDFPNAEKTLKEGLRLQPTNIVALQNLASCLSKQKKYDEAIEILNQLLDTAPNPKAAELLEAIKKASLTGELSQLDKIGIEFNLDDFHVELSGFTQFFLNRCAFEGINPEKVDIADGLKYYIGSEKDAEKDFERLEDGARKFGSKVARTRADLYLSAARISLDVTKDYDQFYRYLCRSLASKGDAAVAENLALDTAREWYCESLNAYDGCLEKFEGGERYDEQDAVNALARFLFSSLGKGEIPTAPPKREREERAYILRQQVQYINSTLEDVITRHLPNQRNKIFDSIAYVTLRSKYAAKRILNHIYSNASLRSHGLEYLKDGDITASAPLKGMDDFVDLWNRLRRSLFEKNRAITGELRYLSNIILTTAWLEDAIERVKGIVPSLLFSTDQNNLRQVQIIMETALQLCREVLFEERERLCQKIQGDCFDLLRQIETSPTKVSVEQLIPLIKIIREKADEYLNELYEESKPQIEIRLAKDTYPNISKLVEVQVLLSNKIGLSPAESLTLFVHEDAEFFTVSSSELKLGKSLRGDQQETIIVLLGLTDKALTEQTFSLTLSATYTTRSGEMERTQPHRPSIKLYPEEDFKVIYNPYAIYAKSGIVRDPKMFYGRTEFIENISTVLQQTQTQGKSVIIYGQKRTGKSSILHHLKEHLSQDPSLLLVDIGDIALLLDEDDGSGKPTDAVLNRLLWLVLGGLKVEIEQRVQDGFPSLEVEFPSVREFLESPIPRMLFVEIFGKFNTLASKTEIWRDVRVVVFIDEFSYIHGLITSKRVPDTFPKYWKAVLQTNYFSAVLVGQDNTPKFFGSFKNEFASTQVERVTYLNKKDAIRLIDEPIHLSPSEGGGSRYRERAIDRVYGLTAGSPFYIQIFCNRLVEYMNNERSSLITQNDVEQVKETLLSGKNRLDDYDFDNLINSGDTSEDAISDDDALKVLKSIATNSPDNNRCHRSSITCNTQAPIKDILDDLLRREVIEKEKEVFYRIKVGLFKEWLIANA